MVSVAITQCGDKYKDIEETQKAASSQNNKKNHTNLDQLARFVQN